MGKKKTGPVAGKLTHSQKLVSALEKVLNDAEKKVQSAKQSTRIAKNPNVEKFLEDKIGKLLDDPSMKVLLEKLALRYETSKEDALEGILISFEDKVEEMRAKRKK